MLREAAFWTDHDIHKFSIDLYTHKNTGLGVSEKKPSFESLPVFPMQSIEALAKWRPLHWVQNLSGEARLKRKALQHT